MEWDLVEKSEGQWERLPLCLGLKEIKPGTSQGFQ